MLTEYRQRNTTGHYRNHNLLGGDNKVDDILRGTNIKELLSLRYLQTVLIIETHGMSTKCAA